MLNKNLFAKVCFLMYTYSMKVVVQRCKNCQVSVYDKVTGNISNGFLVLLGIGKKDTQKQVQYIVKKLAALRIFEDDSEKMNLDIMQTQGEILIVSNFTLYGATKGTNRPDFFDAMPPAEAKVLYDSFVEECKKYKFKSVQTGIFGAEMQINMKCDGPVTIIIEN